MPACPEIKRFVQQTLGCTCPDQVFDQIDYEQRHISGNVGMVRRIDVGHRLLVYLVETDDRAWLQRHLAEILQAGVADRDCRGMNRFRLVIASHQPEVVGSTVQAEFRRLPGIDDKVHLHLVAHDALDGIKPSEFRT